MARDSTWLSKLKSQISNKILHPKNKLNKSLKSSNVGVLAFEISGLLSKLLVLYQSLSDKNIVRLKNEAIALEGVMKIVSNDESFLLGLACAEMLQNLFVISRSVKRLSSRCTDLELMSFPESLEDLASTGRDLHGYAVPVQCGKDMEGLARRADRYIAATAALYREMEELDVLLHNRKKTTHEHVLDLQHKIVWQKQQIKHVKEKSLWSKNYDSVVLLLVRLIFTVLARVKFVFGIGNRYNYCPHPSTLPRSLSTSATVFPSSDLGNQNNLLNLNVSGPLTINGPVNFFSKMGGNNINCGFFESRTKHFRNPPPTTLGAAALALHYANLIIVLEKMIKSPHLVGLDAREDVYAMLPNSIRSSLRNRLKGVGFTATDPSLASEWKDALGRILAWLGPLAHNMIKWQSERSFEQQNLMPKSTNVLLLQTLYFANKNKCEAAITELLVGLNYIWRFEREMNAKALLECSTYFLNKHDTITPATTLSQCLKKLPSLTG